ncbi:hypothetical protein ACRRTK_004967 [Alexandromys fortis]
MVPPGSFLLQLIDKPETHLLVSPRASVVFKETPLKCGAVDFHFARQLVSDCKFAQ